jgi:hypothetical protein
MDVERSRPEWYRVSAIRWGRGQFQAGWRSEGSPKTRSGKVLPVTMLRWPTGSLIQSPYDQEPPNIFEQLEPEIKIGW